MKQKYQVIIPEGMKHRLERKQPHRAKSSSPVNAFCLVLLAAAISFGIALHVKVDREEPFRHQKMTAPEAGSQTADDQAAFKALIDRSVAEAEAHKVPKTALAMLELYGSDQESRWATKVAKGE